MKNTIKVLLLVICIAAMTCGLALAAEFPFRISEMSSASSGAEEYNVLYGDGEDKNYEFVWDGTEKTMYIQALVTVAPGRDMDIIGMKYATMTVDPDSNAVVEKTAAQATAILKITGPGKVNVTLTVKKGAPVAEGEYKFTVTASEKLSSSFSVTIDSFTAKAGQDVDVTAKAAVTSGSGIGSQDAVLIVALYDKNNSMVSYSYAKKSVAEGETVTLGAGFNVPLAAEGYKVKVMVWKDWESQEPLTEAIEKTVSAQ